MTTGPAQFCTHQKAVPWLTIPFDVKSNRDTAFGHLLRCPDCGHGMSDTIPTESEIQAHYDLDSYYTHGESHMQAVPSTFLDRVVIKIAWTFEGPSGSLSDFIATHAPVGASILDVGAGSGRLLRELQDRGYRVEGIDPDGAAIEYAAKNGITLYKGTAEAPPAEVATARYDVVTMTHVLEHCVHPEKALQNINALLKDDGIFYCEVPNCGATYFERHSQIAEMLDVPRHLQFFTKASLLTMCDAAGFEPIAFHFTGFTRHFNPTWCAWENSIWRRLSDRGVELSVPRRTLAGSIALLAATAFAPDELKYDCLGVLLRRKRDIAARRTGIPVVAEMTP